MTTMRTILTRTALTLAAIGVVMVPAAAQAAPEQVTARSGPTATVQASVQWTWRWSDGVTAHSRTFRQDQYGTAANLPYLQVYASPCQYGTLVKLQFRQDGKYLEEDRAYTNGCKAVRLHFDPYTSGGQWANGVWKERLMIPGVAYHYFTIEYVR